MKNSVRTNYIFNLFYQILSLIVPLITMPYISRVLGAEAIGVHSYTFSIVRYFWLLSALGFSTLGARNIGYYQGDIQKRSDTFWSIVMMKLILTCIFTIMYFGCIFVFFDNVIVSAIQGIYLIGVMFDITFLFQGMEDFKILSIRNTIIKIVNVILVFTLIKSSEDLYLYVFLLAIFSVISNISVWILARKYILNIKKCSVKPFSYLKDGILLFFPCIATQIFAVIDKSMIGWITHSDAQNGYYEQAFKIVDMSIMIITSLSSVMIPRIASNFKKGNMGVITGIMYKSLRFTFMISIPMCVGLILISKEFVVWFLGDKFVAVSNILAILSLLFIFMGINSIMGIQYLISVKKHNIHTACLFVGGIMNIICNLIFIYRFGAIGAAIGSVFGEFVVSICEIIYLTRTKVISISGIIKCIYRPIVGTFVFAIFIILMKEIINMNNVISIMGTVISSAVIYFITLLLLRDDFILEEINKILLKIRRKSV